MYKGKDYDRELKQAGVKLDRKKPDDRKVEIDTKRAAPSHNSDHPNQKPVRGLEMMLSLSNVQQMHASCPGSRVSGTDTAAQRALMQQITSGELPQHDAAIMSAIETLDASKES